MSTFDERADQALEPLRNNRRMNSLFGFASAIGDFSLIWHLIGLLYAVGSMHRLQQALALSLALGAESLIVNQAG